MIPGDHKLYDGYTRYYYADYFTPAVAAKYDTLYDYLFAIGQLSASDRDEENARLGLVGGTASPSRTRTFSPSR